MNVHISNAKPTNVEHLGDQGGGGFLGPKICFSRILLLSLALFSPLFFLIV